jgi:hypothetical protein
MMKRGALPMKAVCALASDSEIDPPERFEIDCV